MIKLFTPVELPQKAKPISLNNKILTIGSCFSEEVAERMKRSGFDVTINPFGVLYNPISIARMIEICDAEDAAACRVVMNEGKYHSLMHHSRFSASTAEELQQKIGDTIQEGKRALQQSDIVVFTFGSAYVYEREGEVVGNCHKLPEKEFCRRLLTVDEIVERMSLVLQMPLIRTKRIIVTVSPIRHLRDGLHQNQVSKSVLMLAIEELRGRLDNIEYFPSYEIVLDELRDYRFYAQDMMHPSATAVDYVYERFAQTYFLPTEADRMRQAEKLYRSQQHRAMF